MTSGQFAVKTAETMHCVSAALEKAQEELQVKEAATKAASALIAGAVDACVTNDRIDAGEKQELARALESHENAIRFIAKLAAHRNAAEAGRLGSQVNGQSKKASNDKEQRSCYVGQRVTGETEADRSYLRGLGLDHLIEGGN